MGELNKIVFKHFVDFECDRQLLLDLGAGDARWLAPVRAIARDDWESRASNQGLVELGKEYERLVYSVLSRNRRAVYKVSSSMDAVVAWSALDGEALERLHGELCAASAPTEFYLLEHQWPTPGVFARGVLGLEGTEAAPFSKPPGQLRPDLHVVGNLSDQGSEGAILEVLPDGRTAEVARSTLAGRFGIQIIDIKNTNEQRVGKSHLVEILYYAVALSGYLVELGLEDRFFVRAAGNGILPKHPFADLAGLIQRSPAELSVPVVWEDTQHIFQAAVGQIQALFRGAPHRIEEVRARIQPSCGRCAYLVDCKQTHQCGGPADWDLALLPYVSFASAEQLREMDFKTIGDVARGLDAIEIGSTPRPIYAELAQLRLKAQALVAQADLPASLEHTGGEVYRSIALPRYSEVNLFFDVETDPTNEVVFALGLYLDFDVYKNAQSQSPFYAVHEAWWRFWREALGKKSTEVDFHALEACLDPTFLRECVDMPQAALHATFRAFGQALRRLDRTPGGELSITMPGEELVGRVRSRAMVGYQYHYINSGMQSARGYHDDEEVVARNLIKQLHDILTVSHGFERMVRVAVRGKDLRGQPATYSIGPNFAGFYWSSEQLVHVQDLLERHLPALVDDQELRVQLEALLSWLAPSQSGVTHAEQHKKIFNLRDFVESCIGMPEIINVTWHGVHRRVRKLSARTYERRFWAPHFNYMDFSAWHEYVNERDSNQKDQLKAELQYEVLRKLWALRDLLTHFRGRARDLISNTRKQPVQTERLAGTGLPASTHVIGRIWSLYAQLNSAIQELEAEHFRTTFPSASIARLAAAEVTRLRYDQPPPDTARFSFELHGLSTNIKLKTGDHLLLIPESRRDASGRELGYYTVIIDSMAWDAAAGSYHVEAALKAKENKVLSLQELKEPRWYLYPTASDVWSGRLLKLMSYKDMGTSWLGARLAVLWNLGTQKTLDRPTSWWVGAPELYLFAPRLLPDPAPRPDPTLLTTAFPPPDASQTAAINAALGATLSCIQGPPGTGKSQTLAAMIDELLCRTPGPLRVLVTGFSYSALEVVLDKVRAQRDAKGARTAAANTQLVWMHSAGRDPIADHADLPHVTDLVADNGLTIDGVKGDRRTKQFRGKTLVDLLDDRFILFANAHSLAKLAAPPKKKPNPYDFLPDDFGFDLILVDEASQLPTDHILASLNLVRPATASLTMAGGVPPDAEWPLDNLDRLNSLALAEPLDPAQLTRIVIVGDDNQLPPVQPVKPPQKLRRVLDSLFNYYVDGHGVGHHQLRVNYRSHPTIVDYTRSLGLYQEGLVAFREAHPHPPLPPPPDDLPTWLRDLLSPDQVVGTLIHQRNHETAVSPFEAHLVVEIAVAFFRQLGVSSAEAERRFWQEDLGIVAPHNAQGRQIIRGIHARLTNLADRRTHLDDDELMRELRGTIYSVEKFQGSDRTFIIGSMGISSRDQLSAEEQFIYDLNRFNVLTSRARQKMLLLCSKNYLDYLPRDRESMTFAARIRGFAYGFCDVGEELEVVNEVGRVEVPGVVWRHRL